MQTQSTKLNLIDTSFGDGTLNRADIINERLKVELLSLSLPLEILAAS
jgi:hypothetical protein